MPKYTLMYFDGKGRAEPSRYMFALAGVEYEDKRVGDDWKDIKPTTPLGQLPVLIYEGKQLPQSNAIHRFVAAELDFYGSSNWERAQIEAALETGLELSPNVVAIFKETDEAKKAELKKKLENEQLPKTLANMEKLLKQNNGGDGWFVGDKVSLADVEFFGALHDFYPNLFGKPSIDLSQYEKLAALFKRFKELPQIADWIQKRPVTKM